jgi:uncharacterized protein YoaH (UPF0181 family)
LIPTQETDWIWKAAELLVKGMSQEEAIEEIAKEHRISKRDLRAIMLGKQANENEPVIKKLATVFHE